MCSTGRELAGPYSTAGRWTTTISTSTCTARVVWLRMRTCSPRLLKTNVANYVTNWVSSSQINLIINDILCHFVVWSEDKAPSDSWVIRVWCHFGCKWFTFWLKCNFYDSIVYIGDCSFRAWAGELFDKLLWQFHGWYVLIYNHVYTLITNLLWCYVWYRWCSVSSFWQSNSEP